MKRIVAITLTLVMLLGCFAGCGGKTTGSETSAVPASDKAPETISTPVEQTDSAAEPETLTSEAEPETVERTVITYPITDDVETFTMCYSVFGVINMMLENGYTDAPIFQAMEDATGVRFEVEQMDLQTYQEKLKLMIASDSLPDVVSGLLQVYTTGAGQALDEEVIVDLAPNLDDCAPDYKAAIEAFDGGMASVTTDDGRMGAMYEIYSVDNAYSNGYFIRDDMLEATGLDLPTTPDELLEIGKAIRNSGVEYPIYVNSDGDETGLLIDLWYNQWGYMDWYWDAEAEHVEYSYVQDYNYDYIQWLREAWQEGLFLSSGASQMLALTTSFNDLFRIGAVALFNGKASTIDEELATLDKTTSVTAIPSFTGSNTEQGELQSITGQIGVCISAGCEDVETVLKALNYLYTDDGSFLSNYGQEGESYTLVNGAPEYTDIVMNNPNVAQRFALAYYTNPVFPSKKDPYAVSYSWSEYAREASDIWRSAFTGAEATFDETRITLTADEQETINKYMSDLDTYCTETLYGFVYGATEPTEAAFETFVNQCYDTLHLQDILDVYTEAWLRYQQRLSA